MNNEIKPADHPHGFDANGVPSDAEIPAVETSLVPLVLPQPPRKRKLVTTLTLTSRTCKWPIGDPAASGFHYCGLPPQSGRPYCDEHDRMSYQATPRKRPSPAFRP
mgnify:FL=1